MKTKMLLLLSIQMLFSQVSSNWQGEYLNIAEWKKQFTGKYFNIRSVLNISDSIISINDFLEADYWTVRNATSNSTTISMMASRYNNSAEQASLINGSRQKGRRTIDCRGAEYVHMNDFWGVSTMIPSQTTYPVNQFSSYYWEKRGDRYAPFDFDISLNKSGTQTQTELQSAFISSTAKEWVKYDSWNEQASVFITGAMYHFRCDSDTVTLYEARKSLEQYDEQTNYDTLSGRYTVYRDSRSRHLVTADYLTVRKSPRSGTTVVGRLPNGSELTVITRTYSKSAIGTYKAHWYFVKSGEVYGWVYGAFVGEYQDMKRNKRHNSNVVQLMDNSVSYSLNADNLYFSIGATTVRPSLPSDPANLLDVSATLFDINKDSVQDILFVYRYGNRMEIAPILTNGKGGADQKELLSINGTQNPATTISERDSLGYTLRVIQKSDTSSFKILK